MAQGKRSPGGSEPLLEAFVAGLVAGRGGCLVLEGSLREVPSAPDDVQVIAVRSAPDEHLLAYAGLAELCAPLLAMLEVLPPVQARALEGALAIGPPAGDALAVATGFRSLLHVVAERAPLLLLVEDAHLLDAGTAAALAYTARRLGDAPLGIVLTQDPTAPGALVLADAQHGVAGGEPQARSGVGPVDGADALRRAEDRGSASDTAAALEAIAEAQTGAPRRDALVRAGQAWLAAGQPDRAEAAAEASLAEVHDDQATAADEVLTARAELLLGRVEAVRGNSRASTHHLARAAERAAAPAPRLAAEAELLIASPALFAGRLAAADDALAAARAHTTAAGVDDDDPLCRLLMAAETAAALATGRPCDIDPIEAMVAEVLDLRTADDLSLLVTAVALPMIWLERYERAADLLGTVVSALRARGAIGALPVPLCGLAVAERRRGRPVRSLIHAAEARELATQVGDRGALLFARSELANAHSLFGDVERCRVEAEAVLASGTRGAFRTSALSALATVELWSGDPSAVIDLLEPLTAAGDALSQSVTLFEHNLIAAYVAVGRTDDARRLLADLQAAVPPGGSRIRAVVERCEALLAPADERDRRFADAVEAAAGQPVNQALTRLLHARRLLADGCTATAARLLHELSGETDENLLGVARSARLSLTRLGMVAAGGDPAWSLLGPAELEVALAAADQTPLLTLADRLRLSPPEVERLRDSVLSVVGARSVPEVVDAMQRPVAAGPADAAAPPPMEVRLLGGLSVRVDGEPVAVPTGAASVAVAMVALRRVVHVEELTDALWPDAAPDVARRRLRNVLARVKQSAGEVLARRGERIELAPDVVVDHHVLEDRGRRALALPPGRDRDDAVRAALDAYRPFLPELLYEEWAAPARHRVEARQDELRRALEGRAG